jgi:hypothetical protein
MVTLQLIWPCIRTQRSTVSVPDLFTLPRDALKLSLAFNQGSISRFMTQKHALCWAKALPEISWTSEILPRLRFWSKYGGYYRLSRFSSARGWSSTNEIKAIIRLRLQSTGCCCESDWEDRSVSNSYTSFEYMAPEALFVTDIKRHS